MKTNLQTQKPALTIERIFNATPEKLWSYWTDPKKYAKWLNPAPIDLVIHEWDLREGGKVRFDMPQPDGNKNPQTGVFLKLDPPKELVTGEADESFVIQALFQPLTAKMTRMIVNIWGLPQEWRGPATQGWNTGLDKLERLIGEGSALPKTSGENQGFTIERTFKAKPEKVWEMWTTKAGLEKWWVLSARDMGFTMTVAKLDVRPGGQYEFVLKDKKVTLRNHGTYTEVKPHTRLAWTWNFDIFLAPDEKPYDVPISVELQPVPGGTKMTFRQGPLASAEHTEGSRQGVMANFAKLAQALEV